MHSVFSNGEKLFDKYLRIISQQGLNIIIDMKYGNSIFGENFKIEFDPKALRDSNVV